MEKNFKKDEQSGGYPFDQNNQIFPSHETLVNNNSYSIEDAFNSLNIFSPIPSVPPSYPHHQQQPQPLNHHLPYPYVQTPPLNRFPYGRVLNNSSSLADMEFQQRVLLNRDYQKYLEARLASSPLRNYSFGQMGFQGFEGFSASGLYPPAPPSSLTNAECEFHYNKLGFPQSRESVLRSPVLNNSHLQTQLQQNPDSLWQMRGQLLALAKDQHGCRFLQTKLGKRNEEEIKIIFMELKGYITRLMVEPFGNYLVQKLLEVCNEEIITEILHLVTRDQYELIDVCCSTHGTRSIQKFLTFLRTPQQIAIFTSSLKIGVVMMCKDGNGHHVIQYCFKHFSNEANKYLFKEVADHIIEIAVDKSGCCALQQCILATDRELRDLLVAKITSNALILSQDPYGNYVVQFLVSMREKHITEDLVRHLQWKFESLSSQKFSSNVVQRILNEAEEEEAEAVIKELLHGNLLMLIQDPYANYVVQSAMSVAKGVFFNAFVRVIEMHFQSLCNHPYGKNVVTQMNLIMKVRQKQHLRA